MIKSESKYKAGDMVENKSGSIFQILAVLDTVYEVLYPYPDLNIRYFLITYVDSLELRRNNELG